MSVTEALLVLEPGQLGRVPRPRLVHICLEALAGGAGARDIQLAAAAAHCQLSRVPAVGPCPRPVLPGQNGAL